MKYTGVVFNVNCGLTDSKKSVNLLIDSFMIRRLYV